MKKIRPVWLKLLKGMLTWNQVSELYAKLHAKKSAEAACLHVLEVEVAKLLVEVLHQLSLMPPTYQTRLRLTSMLSWSGTLVWHGTGLRSLNHVFRLET